MDGHTSIDSWMHLDVRACGSHGDSEIITVTLITSVGNLGIDIKTQGKDQFFFPVSL